MDVSDVVAVISQPDRPAGRGLSLRKPAVKVCAERAGIEVHQPTKVRTQAFAELIRSFNADVGVVVAYGRILPLAILEAPKHGCVNVHASLLPRWRGAAPIQWSVAKGDPQTGVTLMQMDEGMDTGPMLKTRVVEIDGQENAGELSVRLSKVGAALLKEELPAFVAGELPPIEQNEDNATHARLLKKSDGEIRWQLSAQQVHDWIRGMNPWPGAFTFSRNQQIKIHKARPLLTSVGEALGAGEVLGMVDGSLLIGCGQGVLAVDELQQSGKKRMSAESFASGQLLSKGAFLSSKEPQ